MKFYIFEVKNEAEIKAGGKPELEEKGPYTYYEYREKIDLSFSNESDPESVTFGQKKTWVFSKENSCADCDKTDKIKVINAPLIGIVAQLTFMGGFLESTYKSNFAI